jgi:small subunit ribosomal protein S15
MKHTEKKEIITKYARSKSDTGSPEVQIALLTVRIESLTSHLNEHKKDNHSRRGLLGLVQKRRKLKNYLQKTNPEAYKKVVEEVETKKVESKAATTAAKAEKAAKKAAPKKEKAEKAEKKAPAKKTAKKK